MTIIDALKSGQRYRRKSDPPMVSFTGEKGWYDECNYCEMILSKEDILADDWETEEISRVITKSALYEALDHACLFNDGSWIAQKEIIAKALGLE